ncbi:MAG: VOC family protein [Verrucomicrobiota bacterium]
MGIGIKEIAFVGYPVTDMDRSRKFYGEVLGLEESETFEHEGEVGWVEDDIQGQTLALAKASDHWMPHKDGAGVSLEVESLEAALEQLKKHQVLPSMPIGDFPACRITVIPDPDGNGIALHQRKPHHPNFSS